MDTAEHTALHRLAAYGTLGPGGPNDHQLDGLQGRWLEGYVNGRLVAEGWGASLGFPALILSSGGPGYPCSRLRVGRPPGTLDAPRRFRGTRLSTRCNDGPHTIRRCRLIHLRPRRAGLG